MSKIPHDCPRNKHNINNEETAPNCLKNSLNAPAQLSGCSDLGNKIFFSVSSSNFFLLLFDSSVIIKLLLKTASIGLEPI